jgi:hypothetical protein
MGRKGGRGRGKANGELELSDRDQAMAALRKSLSSGNSAAVVAAAKALIDLAPERGGSRGYVGPTAEELRLRARLAHKELDVAVLRMELREARGSELNDAELDQYAKDLLDEVLRIFLGHAEKANATGAGHARPGPELAAEMEARRAERREQEPVSPPAVSAPSQPFQDPAFVQALEERRSLGLGPVWWDDED